MKHHSINKEDRAAFEIWMGIPERSCPQYNLQMMAYLEGCERGRKEATAGLSEVIRKLVDYAESEPCWCRAREGHVCNKCKVLAVVANSENVKRC